MAQEKQEHPKRLHIFDSMTWPLIDGDLAWRLIHAPESVTSQDKMYLASVLSAYAELIRCGRDKREHVCRELRNVGPLTCTCPLHRLSKEERAELIDRAIDKTNEEFGIKKHDA